MVVTVCAIATPLTLPYMDATAKNGDVWSGEKNGDWWIYSDNAGNLYESKEVPAYRISMNQAAFINGVGILPVKQLTD